MLQTKIFDPILNEYNHNDNNNNLEYIYKTFCQVMLFSIILVSIPVSHQRISFRVKKNGNIPEN